MNSEGGTVTVRELTELVYELIDAHGDTVALAGELGDARDWGAHIDYLQGLQRVARAALARIPDPAENPVQLRRRVSGSSAANTL